MPDLPGCTAAGDDRDEIERDARAAVAAHVALLRSTGRPVPDGAIACCLSEELAERLADGGRR